MRINPYLSLYFELVLSTSQILTFMKNEKFQFDTYSYDILCRDYLYLYVIIFIYCWLNGYFFKLIKSIHCILSR
jgi:hypothetical protein